MANKRKFIYLVGSLRNEEVAEFANRLEEATGYEVFASWHAAGPEADDYWKKHEQARGRNYREALASYAAQHVFKFDKTHIDMADGVVLLLPAGKSGHLELGYAVGKGTPGFILLEEGVDRWDVMYNFATGVCDTFEELVAGLKRAVG